MELNLLAYTTL